MKKFFIFIILVVLNFNISYAKANNKIAFVDLNYILAESMSGKKILSELNDLNKQNTKQFKTTEINLEKKQNEIKKLKNIISSDEYLKKINEFKSNVEEYNKEKSLIIDKFENLKKKELEDGFVENNVRRDQKNIFFNQGKANQWEKLLPKDIRIKIEKAFENEMLELDYLK